LSFLELLFVLILSMFSPSQLSLVLWPLLTSAASAWLLNQGYLFGLATDLPR
jgi:hypothetical protein